MDHSAIRSMQGEAFILGERLLVVRQSLGEDLRSVSR